jgi:hypothetical protein
MAEYVRGIKAGIIAGIVYSIIDSIVFIFAGPAILAISSVAWTTMMLLTLGSLIIGAVVGGAIAGLIYAYLGDTLPTKSPITRGIIVGVIFWFVFGLALNTTYLTDVFFLVESFVLKAVVFGVLLCFLWKVFVAKE